MNATGVSFQKNRLRLSLVTAGLGGPEISTGFNTETHRRAETQQTRGGGYGFEETGGTISPNSTWFPTFSKN